MSEPSARDWRILFAAAMLEGDNTQLGLRIEKAEAAIQARLTDVAGSFSASEEADLYSARQNLQRLKAQILTSA